MNKVLEWINLIFGVVCLLTGIYVIYQYFTGGGIFATELILIPIGISSTVLGVHNLFIKKPLL